MNFGQALEALEQGKKVQRTGWNGKGMFLFLVPGSTFSVNRPPLLGIYPEGTEIRYHAHVDMRTADGTIVPWLCSQTDMLAKDWELFQEKQEEPKTFNCPSRGLREDAAPHDCWYIRDSYRTCSYCGSMHPDQFMVEVKEGRELSPTDKDYKVYLNAAGNPHTKFYFEHLSDEQREEFVHLLNEGKLKIGFPGHFYRLPFFMKVIDEPIIPQPQNTQAH